MSAGSRNPPPPTALAATEVKKKKLFPLDRIILLVLLLVVVVLVVIDYRARFAYQSALERVAGKLPEVDEAVDLNPVDFEAVPTQQEVQALVGKAPDKDSHRNIDVGVVEEIYSWRGIFRTFAFRVQYRKFRDDLRLEGIASIGNKDADAAQTDEQDSDSDNAAP